MDEFAGKFDYFHRAGTEGISRMTNLSTEKAARANTREFSEPLKWFGDGEELEGFLQRLHSAGASTLRQSDGGVSVRGWQVSIYLCTFLYRL